MGHLPSQDELVIAEYAALRTAIAARGHLRLGLFLAGLIGWALTLLAVLVLVANPLVAVLPLLVLVGTFESLRSLHFGVERIGRYLQVFVEERYGSDAAPWEPPAWERVVVRVGGQLPGAAGHPLFAPVLALATAINVLAIVLPGPRPEEWIPLGALHLLFVGWMVYVDRGARAQRSHDEAKFRAIREHKDHEGHEGNLEKKSSS